MPDSTKKYAIQQKQADGMLTLHPETEAPVVTYDGTSAGLVATNVQDAIDELKTLVNDITGGGVVTGVKGDAEETYRQGNVNITKANIGLGNVDNTADLDKPISNATQDALNGKANTTGTYSGLTAGKVEHILTIGGKTYDGSAAVTINKADLGITGAYVPAGSSTFANLPTPSADNIGNVYNMTEAFTTDARFLEGAGKLYPLGTNVVIVQSDSSYLFDVLSGFIDFSHYAEIDGTYPDMSVGHATTADTATNATNVTTNINGHAISTIFETNGTTVKNATHATEADTADDATNVTGSINDVAIATIFETNGSTVKNATHSTTADRLSTARNISLSGDVSGTTSFNGSQNVTITASLANVGTAGTYSVVTTDAKGRVTAGGQIIEVGTTGQDAPSASLAVGGLFFKEI